MEEEQKEKEWIAPPRKLPSSSNLPNPFLDSFPNENENISSPETEEIWCSAARVRKERWRSRFTLHRSKFDMNTWPRSTDICCWHDVHQFSTIPIPLPVRIDTKTGKFEVIGTFCSFACAKAYFFEHVLTLFKNQGECLLYLARLAQQLLGYTKPLISAPPRFRLRQFGGDLDIKEFRDMTPNFQSFVYFPPLVHAHMVHETRSRETAQSMSVRLRDSSPPVSSCPPAKTAVRNERSGPDLFKEFLNGRNDSKSVEPADVTDEEDKSVGNPKSEQGNKRDRKVQFIRQCTLQQFLRKPKQKYPQETV